MPTCKIDTIVSLICHLILLLMEGIYLFIILCTYAHGILIQVYNQLLQLVISTTHHVPTYRTPTPPPPIAPSLGTPSFPTLQPRSYTPVIIENKSLSPTQLATTQHTLLPSPTPSTSWDLLDILRECLEQLHNCNNPDHPSTCGNTPDYNPLPPSPITTSMTTLLELINNLTLSTCSPEDTSPKSANAPSTPLIFNPNPSNTLDIPPPPMPNPFQPSGPNYSWGSK
ncbi:hypothetical protein JAAARDRAFT_200925 [Jaapia argillacea MUCL 33604]|uniref:Uncharacterized protein n=1 Tax=Jaapia argillacea MUCL 33604 TaxID=933084 RepID=A0A067P345_9AGAM|nr:hypothetical protein JAAARDRAFT_200925 [Jaapia argillacea MUCL 33604]